MKKIGITMMAVTLMLGMIVFGGQGLQADPPEPCNGPCLRKIIDCQGGGFRCYGPGDVCGDATVCQGH